MMIRKTKKETSSRKVPLLLLYLLIVLLFSLCLVSATVYATSIQGNPEESSTVMDKESDNVDNGAIIAKIQETTPTTTFDFYHTVPEDPPTHREEKPRIKGERQPKITIAPELYQDAMFYYFLVDDSYYEVAGMYRPCFDKIEIPTELFGVPVKGIQSCAFRNYKHLVSVVIPESIEYIGDYAFYNCPNLTSITLPETDIKIGEGVFEVPEE